MKEIKRTEAEYVHRQKLIDTLESETGSLMSMPYSVIDTEDLQALADLVEDLRKAEAVIEDNQRW